MAAALADAGVESLVQPLLGARTTGQALPDECFDKVIFVSEHAVQLGKEAVEKLAIGVQWYAIGPATGAALAKLVGASSGRAQESVRVPKLARSEGLLREPQLQSVDGANILLVAGEDGRELIADTLSARGARVTNWLVYRRVALQPAGRPGAGADARKAWPVDACVASSGMGLELLTRWWFGDSSGLEQGDDGSGAGAQVPVCVPSPRIAKMAKELGWRVPVLCSGASAQATLEGLRDAGLLN